MMALIELQSAKRILTLGQDLLDNKNEELALIQSISDKVKGFYDYISSSHNNLMNTMDNAVDQSNQVTEQLKTFILVLLVILASQILSLLLMAALFQSKIVFVYVNVIWIKNLIVCFGIGLVTYHQGILYKRNETFCMPYNTHDITFQKDWVKSHAKVEIWPLLDVCIFGRNNHDLNSVMNIQHFQNNMISFSTAIKNFPNLAAGANTDAIKAYDR